MKAKRNYNQEIADKFIKEIENGTAPWQRPWEQGELILPVNGSTGNTYRGINSINLLMSGYNDPRWYTFKQAQSLDAQVKKGERATPIMYWKLFDEKVVKGKDGKPMKDDKGKTIKEKIELERPYPLYASVFNANQIDGLPTLDKEKYQVWLDSEKVESIIENSKADINHDQRDSAFYRPFTDKIHLPEKALFKDNESYYSTVLHELSHWTGHESRLNRDLTGQFGSQSYAKEELRAEISSFMICAELGITAKPANHASYVEHWLKILKDDPQEIFRASAQAEKMSKYIMGFQQSLSEEKTNTNSNVILTSNRSSLSNKDFSLSSMMDKKQQEIEPQAQQKIMKIK